MQQTSNLSAVMQLTHYSLLSSSILLFSLLLLQSIKAVESTTSSNPKTGLDDFIKKSCQVTLYSDLCYSSLSSSYTGDLDLRKLTYTAIRISLTEAVHTADYVVAVSNKTTTGADVAVRDCVELTKDAVRQVGKSLDQMGRILKRSEAQQEDEGEKRFEMSDVQTWMSAAITDQNTCLDGFNDVEDGKDDEEVKSEVSGKIGMVLKLISNALALVNTFVDATK